MKKEKYTQQWHEKRVRLFNEHVCNHDPYCGSIEASMESPDSTEAHHLVAMLYFLIGGALAVFLF